MWIRPQPDIEKIFVKQIVKYDAFASWHAMSCSLREAHLRDKAPAICRINYRDQEPRLQLVPIHDREVELYKAT